MQKISTLGYRRLNTIRLRTGAQGSGSAPKMLDVRDVRGRLEVRFQAQETLAGSKDAGWTSPTHMAFAGALRDWEWRGMSMHPESASCPCHIPPPFPVNDGLTVAAAGSARVGWSCEPDKRRLPEVEHSASGRA